MVSIHAASIAANQFFQGLLGQLEAPQPSWQITPALPAAAQTATDNLLAIMRTLCAPDSGWPEDKPQIPDNLLPYVSDETEELLETLQPWVAAISATTASIKDPPASSLAANPATLVADLSAFLLWAIAASHPTAMKLLEGVSARLSQHPDAYGVRLVPVLKLRVDGEDYALDLATQTHFASSLTLAESAVLQLPDQTSPALMLSQWQTLFWRHAIAIAPGLEKWQHGITGKLLLPGHNWATTTASLALKFVPLTLAVTVREPASHTWEAAPAGDMADAAMPSARVWHAEPDLFSAFETDIISNESLEMAQKFSLESDVTLTDFPAVQRAIAPTEIERLGQSATLNPQDIAAQLAPLNLVERIYQVIRPEQTVAPLLLRSPLSLGELCHQVKWLWIRASQDLMPLMSGISARCLTVGHVWEMGTIATIGQLVIREAGHNPIVLDVTTGEWESDLSTVTAADDMLHLQTSTALPRSLWQVADLETYLNDLTRQRSPILAYLQTEVPITVTSPHDALFPESAKTPLTLQFKIAIKFLA